MKAAGGFDSATGSYEKFLQYLPPLNNLLTVPMVIIGLTAPDKFRIEHYSENRKTYIITYTTLTFAFLYKHKYLHQHH